jgi:hypothetical protein
MHERRYYYLCYTTYGEPFPLHFSIKPCRKWRSEPLWLGLGLGLGLARAWPLGLCVLGTAALFSSIASLAQRRVATKAALDGLDGLDGLDALAGTPSARSILCST